MIRRFVNLVAQNFRGAMAGAHSLHRLDASKHFFYPSTAEAEAAAAAAAKPKDGVMPWLELDRLPEPSMQFQPSNQMWADLKLEQFALASPHSSEGRVLCTNRAGRALLYDADSRTVLLMPSLGKGKRFRPIAFSAARPGAGEEDEEDLYVMNSGLHPADSPCFEVLRFRSRRGKAAWDDPDSDRLTSPHVTSL